MIALAKIRFSNPARRLLTIRVAMSDAGKPPPPSSSSSTDTSSANYETLLKMVSERAQKGLEIPSLSSGQNKLHTEDPYHHDENQEGYIKLSSADNVLCDDLIKAKFKSIDWSGFDTNQLFVYPRGGGELSTLNSAAKFINKYCRKGIPPIPAEELVIVPGVTTGADLLGQILFDSGDVVLVPAPYYFRFANDFGERGLVRIGVVPALSACGRRTELNVARFEQAYQDAQKLGKVRAVTLVNPQNPEGGIFTLDEIRPIVQWAISHDLYVVLDEIYDLTIYDENPAQPFQSATELFDTPASRQKLIWMWGLSKNFSLPGLRFALLHSPNVVVRTACIRFLMHHLPNTTTQFIARQFMDDHEWVEKVFLPENLRRLRAARDVVMSELDNFGVPYLTPRAGFFILMDFSQFLDEPTYEAERRLHQLFLAKKVIVSAGETMFAPKPGWFRLVFSSVHRAGLLRALVRIGNTLAERRKELSASTNGTTAPTNNNSCNGVEKHGDEGATTVVGATVPPTANGQPAAHKVTLVKSTNAASNEQ